LCRMDPDRYFFYRINVQLQKFYDKVYKFCLEYVHNMRYPVIKCYYFLLSVFRHFASLGLLLGGSDPHYVFTFETNTVLVPY
jgi:hypothetical protein